MRLLFGAIAAAFALAGAPAANAQEPIEVMVLGTYHFNGGGADLHNADVEDPRSPEGQRQIAALLDRLEQFAPTKIMVELRPEQEADFNAAYRAYLDGERALNNNERQQLGMALAARMGHDRLYAVDFQNGMDFNAMLASAESASQTRVLGQFNTFNAEIAAYTRRIEEMGVIDRLRAMNGPEIHEMHDGYLVLAQMGTPGDPRGAREMGDWWERNLTIFSNIAYHAESGDRVLVIYGSGHKHLLDRFFDRAPGFVLVDSLEYLQ